MIRLLTFFLNKNNFFLNILSVSNGLDRTKRDPICLKQMMARLTRQLQELYWIPINQDRVRAQHLDARNSMHTGLSAVPHAVR